MSFDYSISTDQLLLTFLAYSKPLREFCGFSKVSDASKITRFKQDFIDDFQLVFDILVDLTESIYQSMDSAKADMTIFDSSGLENFVTENNPKYANRIIKPLKAYARDNSFDKNYDLTSQLIVLCQHTHPQILKLSSYTLMVIFAMSSSLALLLIVLVSSGIYLFTTKTFWFPILKSL